jgi:hypothetical protein
VSVSSLDEQGNVRRILQRRDQPRPQRPPDLSSGSARSELPGQLSRRLRARSRGGAALPSLPPRPASSCQRALQRSRLVPPVPSVACSRSRASSPIPTGSVLALGTVLAGEARCGRFRCVPRSPS